MGRSGCSCCTHCVRCVRWTHWTVHWAASHRIFRYGSCRRERRSMESDVGSLRPRSHRRRNRPKPTRGTSHISSLLTMIRGISRRGTMLRRLRSQETTRGISLSPRLRLLRFLRQCRAICRAMTRGTSPNRFRSRLPAMTRGINRRQFHNRLRRPPRTVTCGINRNPHSRPRMPTRGIASPSPSRNHNRKSRPRMTNTR